MIKLCIFDLDGTILDTLSAIAYFGNNALVKCGFPAIDEERYKYFAGDGRIVLVHRMLQFLDADTSENYKKVSTLYDFEYEKAPNFKTSPFDGIESLLSALKSMGIKIAVLSNKPDNVAQMAVKTFFGDIFDFIQGAVNNVRSKPEPFEALKICDKFGISSDETLFIGDTNVDILTGKNAKMHTCGVLWGFRDKRELFECGAEFIVSNPMEIVSVIENRK
ncbi:MAG: HAD family hydrolase, partial [Firmicutes bacterium]|nr:HAD family hydrolase [Bacillota bacterium]